MPSRNELLSPVPPAQPLPAREVARAFAASGRTLVVLDDDPTGTQSVSNLPVLTRWDVDDFRWAFTVDGDGHPAPAVYVLTNTRSLSAEDAARRNREVVSAALAAGAEAGLRIDFVSRGDSTLRGHFPLEPDVIADVVAEINGTDIDGYILVPAFPDAGRITVGGEHYLAEGDGLRRVSDTEFAQDATFGFSSSYLPAYVAEKSGGRFREDDVVTLDLTTIRTGAEGIAEVLQAVRGRTPVVVDIEVEEDMRALALGLNLAQSRGKNFIYRVGPPFVRARIGQEPHPPLERHEIFGHGNAPSAGRGGLIVVGSHVGVTTRQLARLTEQHTSATVIELDVHQLISIHGAAAYVAQAASRVVDALLGGDVVLHTSRLLVRSDDADESLRISRLVSAGVVTVVNRTLHTLPPRFVIAKGGITSSDVAAFGLEIRRATVRGPMLPGIVSLWQSSDGPAAGIPYVVFAGNVGDDDSLLEVTRKLSSFKIGGSGR
ncbi:hypothetical protein J7E68_03860 [Microbacterium sp. ISL-103]|uniref:four-carbon acid sugar kinase family protein n=1 Tax=Microbacterium sp. ISL-103 TaxID=2819156 RepID=UPI001BE7DF65|nr:four-carbon acid sugar kinase family protein [Microbacterium sp. ISL-103]MBT2473731.1 hypothetical protein [Microbacterium sp. ISL-103]